MGATPQDLQALLDAAVAELEKTTVGYVNGKWKTPPAGTHWATAIADIAAARAEAGLLLAPATPPPPAPTPVPPPSGASFDAVVPALTYPGVTAATPKVYTSLAAFQAAYAALDIGQWIEASGVEFPGQVNFFGGKVLSDYARVSFDATCRFTGTVGGAQTQKPAIWVPNASHVQFVFAPGCDIQNPQGDAGILQHGGDHLVFDGFVIHNIGGTGWGAFPNPNDGTDIHDCFYRGEVYDFGRYNGFDPHAEKGTGIHGMNCGDNPYRTFHHNTVALYVHDSPTTAGGCCIEVGSGAPATSPHDNVFYLKGHDMRMDAVNQTAGNGFNLWSAGGSTAMAGNDFRIVEVMRMEGFAVFMGALVGAMTGCKVDLGRANDCCRNPRYAGKPYWPASNGLVYGDVESDTVWSW